MLVFCWIEPVPTHKGSTAGAAMLEVNSTHERHPDTSNHRHVGVISNFKEAIENGYSSNNGPAGDGHYFWLLQLQSG